MPLAQVPQYHRGRWDDRRPRPAVQEAGAFILRDIVIHCPKYPVHNVRPVPEHADMDDEKEQKVSVVLLPHGIVEKGAVVIEAWHVAARRPVVFGAGEADHPRHGLAKPPGLVEHAVVGVRIVPRHGTGRDGPRTAGAGRVEAPDARQKDKHPDRLVSRPQVGVSPASIGVYVRVAEHEHRAPSRQDNNHVHPDEEAGAPVEDALHPGIDLVRGVHAENFCSEAEDSSGEDFGKEDVEG
mmetsp:Transcript_1520/g.2319  ORF Transcript_1520/g.2319 Transcript_1520/m.2319 type:complete len:239 (-) Transcript_1520:172-888(-)